MATIRANGVAGKLSADLASGGTSMSSAALADLPAVTSPDVAKITLFQTDSNGRVTKQEIVYVTAHTASATSATITRGQEGTTAAAWNGTTAPDSWVHGQTAVECGHIPTVKHITAGNVSFTGSGAGTWTAVSTANDITIPAVAGDLIRVDVGGLWQAANTEVGLDACTLVSGSPVTSVGSNAAAGTQRVSLRGTDQASSGAIDTHGFGFLVLAAGDISGGNVTLRLYAVNYSATSRTLLASSGNAVMFSVINFGQ